MHVHVVLQLLYFEHDANGGYGLALQVLFILVASFVICANSVFIQFYNIFDLVITMKGVIYCCVFYYFDYDTMILKSQISKNSTRPARKKYWM